MEVEVTGRDGLQWRVRRRIVPPRIEWFRPWMRRALDLDVPFIIVTPLSLLSLLVGVVGIVAASLQWSVGMIVRIFTRRAWELVADTPGPPPMRMRWPVSTREDAERAISRIETWIITTGMPPQYASIDDSQ